jgi:superfamily II DNA or RNA helicase
MLKLDRNNTNFPSELFEFFKKSDLSNARPEYAFLKYWQELCRVFVTSIDIGTRGLLVQHQMGFGKGILATAIAVELLSQGTIIMVLAKSLHSNMRAQIKKYIKLRGENDPGFLPGQMTEEEADKWVDKNFAFVSLNAGNMMTQLASKSSSAALEVELGRIVQLPTLDGKTIIVDEAHHIFRMISNGSKNGLAFYEAVCASNCRAFFLTGTPVASDPFEVVPCFNMLHGRHGRPLFPEEYEEFYRLYVDTETKQLKNKGKYQNRIFGLVSSIGVDSTLGAGISQDDNLARLTLDIKSRFPVEFPLVVRHVHMRSDQWLVYLLAREKEKEEGKRRTGGPFNPNAIRPPSAPMTKPKSRAASTYKVRSRQLCNFNSPEKKVAALTTVDSAKFDAMYADIERHAGGLGLIYSQFIGVGGLGAFSVYLRQHGWEAANSVKDEEEKVDPIITEEEIIAPPHPRGHAEEDYSFDIPPDTYEEYMDRIDHMACNGGCIDITGGSSVKRFALLTGSVPIEERERIVAMFTSDANKHGELCALLLVSATGAEGLDLKNLRFVMAMEPYWVWIRYAQLFARAIRIDSHAALPESERNCQPYIYLSEPPESEKSVVDGKDVYVETTDVELFREACVNKLAVASFTNANKEISIECMVNGGDCRTCSPTNKPLFTPDPDADVRRPDPCHKAEFVNIKAEEIIIDGVSYYYTPSGPPFGFTVFTYDKALGDHKALAENDPAFMEVIKKINPNLFKDLPSM